MAASLGTFVGMRRVCSDAPQLSAQPPARSGCTGRRYALPTAAKKGDSADSSAASKAAPASGRQVAQVPEGTPKGVSLDQPVRPRRNRRSPTVRAAFREVRARLLLLSGVVCTHNRQGLTRAPCACRFTGRRC
jgi:hypothetical protein